MDKDAISDRQKVRQELDWIRDLNQKDVDRIIRAPSKMGMDSSARMIYEDCGIETNILLWRKCLGITLYISERPVNELRKLYIRENIDVDDLANSVRHLAITLGCSEIFVRHALVEKPKNRKKDPGPRGEDTIIEQVKQKLDELDEEGHRNVLRYAIKIRNSSRA